MSTVHALVLPYLLLGTGSASLHLMQRDPPMDSAARSGSTSDELPELKALLAAQGRELAELREAIDQLDELSTMLEIPGNLNPDLTDTRLSIYGYADAGMSRLLFRNHRSFLRGFVHTRELTFALGNVNLYFDAEHRHTWRALTEVRFTSLPHGNQSLDPGTGSLAFTSVDTRVPDPASPTGYNTLLIGGVVIERAWVQWSPLDWLRLRVGYWLTPYGIWNQEHGTPSLIALALPQFFALEDFPTHQTGLQLRGRYYGGGIDVDYDLYIANGRTPTLLDYTDDKAVGGQVRFTIHRLGGLRVGASFYRDRHSDERKRLKSYLPMIIEVWEEVAYEEHALAVDVSLDHEGLRLRSEVVYSVKEFDEGKRSPYHGAPTAFEPSLRTANAYFLGAYRVELGDVGVEPYAYAEMRWQSAEAIHGGNAMLVQSLGVNVHLTPRAQLKAQALRALFLDDWTVTKKTRSQGFTAGFIRVVLAF